MKLSFYQGSEPNFGDELNLHVWDKILPTGFLNTDESELFLGIGSILTDAWPRDAVKYVVGSGYGGYNGLPDIREGDWNIVFVRGPRTAAAIGVGPEKAICDSAIFLRDIHSAAQVETKVKISFMPHFESIKRGFWEEACALAGFNFIDPRWSVDRVLAEISSSKVLICEAMHGAIVADILRTPWIAVEPIHSENSAKWLDWGDSLGLDIRRHAMFPSSLMEAWIKVTKGRRYYEGRAKYLRNSKAFAFPNYFMSQFAAQRLAKVAQLDPQLSSDRELSIAHERAQSALSSFVRSKGY